MGGSPMQMHGRAAHATDILAAMKLLLIDAFASRPFTGNPAAVVLLDRDLDDARMQAIAMEMNQAETAYVRSRADRRWDLRWFTPNREVPLCGHATLASAHAIWSEWKLQPAGEAIRFVTRQSGELVCQTVGDQVAMDFPATPPKPCELPTNAAATLGVAGPILCVGSTPMNLTLALPDEVQIRAARPEMSTLATWHPTGVTITARFRRWRIRFRQPILRPAIRHPRRPGDRLGPLFAGGLLVAGSRQDSFPRPPTLPPRRRHWRNPPRRPRRTPRVGHYHRPWPTGLNATFGFIKPITPACPSPCPCSPRRAKLA